MDSVRSLPQPIRQSPIASQEESEKRVGGSVKGFSFSRTTTVLQDPLHVMAEG